MNAYEEGARSEEELERLNDSLLALAFHQYEHIHL